MSALVAQPLTGAAFAPFGEVIEVAGPEDLVINAGKCRRFSDRASFDILDGELGLSLFDAQIRALPYVCDLLERHPKGSQCFIPMGGSAYLVITAEDLGGRPGAPLAFLARPHQSVNIARNVWHGVLAPISGSGLFAVLDRIGPGPNLQEFGLEEPITIRL